MTIELQQLLLGVGVPAGASAAALVALARPWRPAPTDERWGAAARVLAVTLGVLAAVVALLEGRMPPFWPPGIPGRLPAAVGAVAVVETLIALIARPRADVPLRLALALFLIFALFLPYPKAHGWPVIQTAGAGIALAVAMAGAPTALNRIARLRPGASMPLVLWAVATASAVTLVLSYTARIGQLSGALAAGVGPLVLLAWWKPGTRATGAAPAAASILACLLLVGNLTAQLTPLRAVLLGAAPFASAVALIPLLVKQRPWLPTLGALGTATAIAAAAAILAAIVYEPPTYE